MKLKTKISILLPLWMRPDVLNICLKQLEIFVKSNSKEFDILVFFVYSKEDPFLNEIIDLISEFKAPNKKIEHSNMFLGAKMNSGIEFITSFEYDYLMNLGSDDLIHADLLKLYKPYIKQEADIIGIDSCVFYANEKEILLLKYYNQDRAIGAGRLISRNAINTILADGKTVYSSYMQRGLDSDSAINLNNLGFEETVLSVDFPYIVDIKSDININSFEQLKNRYKFENIGFELLQNNYDSKIINDMKKGFISEKEQKGFVKCLNVRKNIIQTYHLNVETINAIRLGYLVEVEPEAEKELKEIKTKELKQTGKTK